MCSWSRSASWGSAIASASSRSAVTGVRSRCDRSPTAARSVASSSTVRSARPLSARASSWVSSVPSTAARADRSPSRSRWAVPATWSNGSLTRLPSREASSRASRSRARAEPEDAGPGADHAAPRVGLRDLGAHHRGARVDQHRQQHPAALVVDHGERLAVAGAVDLGGPGQLGTGPELPPVGEQDPGRGGAALVEVGDQLGQRRVVGQPGHQRARCSAPPGRRRPSPGPRPACAPAGTAGSRTRPPPSTSWR